MLIVPNRKKVNKNIIKFLFSTVQFKYFIKILLCPFFNPSSSSQDPPLQLLPSSSPFQPQIDRFIFHSYILLHIVP